MSAGSCHEQRTCGQRPASSSKTRSCGPPAGQLSGAQASPQQQAHLRCSAFSEQMETKGRMSMAGRLVVRMRRSISTSATSDLPPLVGAQYTRERPCSSGGTGAWRGERDGKSGGRKSNDATSRWRCLPAASPAAALGSPWPAAAR